MSVFRHARTHASTYRKYTHLVFTPSKCVVIRFSWCVNTSHAGYMYGYPLVDGFISTLFFPSQHGILFFESTGVWNEP